MAKSTPAHSVAGTFIVGHDTKLELDDELLVVVRVRCTEERLTKRGDRAVTQVATVRVADGDLGAELAEWLDRPDGQLRLDELEPATAAPVQVDDRPAQHVDLKDLAALELAPARFYAAARMLKSGVSLDEATTGWTSGQRDYLAGFLSTPKKRTPRKKTTPQEAS